jgi:O-phosphoseryl-tRNA(Cys) synthetase
MVSLKLRRIFYSAAIGVDEYGLNRKIELEKITELEKQISLAKKIISSLEEKKEEDPATLIRLEGKLKSIEIKVKEKKRANKSTSLLT